MFRHWDDPRELDHWIAVNVKAQREANGLSQAAVAEAMKELGHDWSQDTVWRVESERRQVRASELADLTDVVTANDSRKTHQFLRLDQPPLEHRLHTSINEQRRKVRRTQEALEDATIAYLRATMDLASAHHHADEEGYPWRNTLLEVPDPVIDAPEMIALTARVAWELDESQSDDRPSDVMTRQLEDRILKARAAFGDAIQYPFVPLKPEDIVTYGGPDGKIPEPTDSAGEPSDG